MMARFMWYLDPLSPHQLKKVSELHPLLQNFLDPHMKGADQTVCMCRLVSAFVVRLQQNQGFLVT